MSSKSSKSSMQLPTRTNNVWLPGSMLPKFCSGSTSSSSCDNSRTSGELNMFPKTFATQPQTLRQCTELHLLFRTNLLQHHCWKLDNKGQSFGSRSVLAITAGAYKAPTVGRQTERTYLSTTSKYLNIKIPRYENYKQEYEERPIALYETTSTIRHTFVSDNRL
jgi:hypothetical protein